MLFASRYELIEEVGQGFMGVVHQAKDLLTGQILALKRVRTPSSSRVDVLAAPDSALRLAFAQEFRILAALRHPHIISVLDYGFDETHHPFFTMDYIENAQTFIQAAKSKPLSIQITLIIQLLQALAYLHRRDVLHRDVKPANVLIANEHLRVLDFGLSSKTSEAVGRSGTLAYMSPEVLRNQPASKQSDLYSVGVMMFEMLIGRLPYDPLDIMSRFAKLPDLSVLEDHPLELVITRLLIPDPDDRYNNANHVIEEICHVMDMPVPTETKAIRESYLQTAPFVGRDSELATLETALDKTLNRQGSVWLVGGESGVGKSRLLDELRIRALVKGALVVRGQGVEGGGVPYQLWRDVLPRLLLSIELDDREADTLKFIVPQIDSIIGRTPSPTQPPETVVDQQVLMATVMNVLHRQIQPVVILLEDLQWTHESLGLLQHLTHYAANESWLLVGSYRQDERPDLVDVIKDSHHLSLKRLDDETIAELSQAMLGETGKQKEVIDLLQRETEGNAFFLVEVVRALAEEAGQMADIGRTTLPDTVITGGIHQISKRRLNRVPQWGQPLLKHAAVIGRQIDEALLQHLANNMSVQEWLTVCSNAAVLEVQDNHWRFAHDKMRETVITELTDSERPILHEEVALAIETVYPDDIHQAQILADHWHYAGDKEKEARYAFYAARHLEQLGLNQAQVFALRALRLNPTDTLLWAQINNLIARNYFERGDYQEAQTHFEATLPHARKYQHIREELDALDGLGQIVYVAKDMEAALKIYRDAIQLARKADDNLMLSRLLKHEGVVLRFLGDHEGAYQSAIASLEVTKKLNNPWELALVLYSVSVIVRNRGEYQQAIEYLEEGIAIYRRLNLIADMGHSLNNLGICHTMLGNYDEAMKYLEEGMECRRQVGHVRGVASSKSAIGDVYSATKRYREAETMYQEALDFWQTIGDKWNIANSHADVGFPLFIRGEVQTAVQHWKDALTQANAIKGNFVILKAIIGFAWVLCEQSDREQSAQLLSFVQEHEAWTKPLDQMWIQPLIERMKLTLPPAPDTDLQTIIDYLLNITI
jgi:tetratricopeptide (TPR) repeat protein/tRNA A-37 threonylcarbamoyl transferase component Bud32